MRSASCRWVLLFALVLAPFSASGDAQQSPVQGTTTAEQRLRQEITREILEELRDGDFLRQQIELGIRDYLQKEQLAKAAAAADKSRLSHEKIKSVRPVSAARDHIFGNPDAVISLIEYSDFECPFCKRFHSTPKEIVQASGGQVNWVYRHLPLGMHNPGAQKQAEASECAYALGGNEAFWKFADAIYARTRSNGQGFPLTQLTPLAVEIGLPATPFQECFDSGTYAARVQEDMVEGAKIGITGTPASILLHNRTGEVRLKSGALPAAAFKEDITVMLR